MQPTIDDFYLPFFELQKMIELNEQNNGIMTNLFTKIKTTYENISNWFRTLGESFHKEILKNNTNENNYVYYQYLGNYLLKISEVNKEFSKKINESVLAPFTETSSQLGSKAQENLTKVQRLLTNLENSKLSLKKHQDNYYKLSKISDKAQETFEKVVQTNKSEDQLLKAQEKFMKIRMEAQEAGNFYRQQLKTTNQHWDALYATYEPVFNQYDELESQKTTHTRKAIISLIKNFNSLYASHDSQFFEDPDEKFKEVDDKSGPKTDTLKFLTNGGLEEILKTKPLEDFHSYEAKKKTDELTLIKSVENDEYTVIYAASNETDIQMILDFTRLFQSRLSMAVSNEASTDINSDQSESPLLAEMALKDRILNDSQASIKFPPTEEDEKKMWEILKNPVNRKFLLDNLVKSKEAVRGPHTVSLPVKSYRYLRNFLKKVLEILLEEKDYDGICSFLNVILKYSSKKEGQTYYLYEHFKGNEIWKLTALWKDIVKNFYEKRSNEDQLKQKKAQETEKGNKGYAQGPLMDKIFNLSVKQFLEKARSRSVSISDKEIYFNILRDVAGYLEKLNDRVSVASEILIQIAIDLGFDYIDIESFINVIKRERNNVRKEKYEQFPYVKKQKAQKKWGENYPLYLSLDFLEPKDLVKLLGLNKELKKCFTKRVYRTIFFNFSGELTFNQRIQIWANILDVKNVTTDYKNYLVEFENLTDPALKQAQEVINIDILRSFKKHGDYDQEVLKDLLKCYAAYNKEVSYCQGMNYMMGFFYLKTNDADLSFKYFIRLMQNHMDPMFDKDFKQLKNYFFKLDRAIELCMPELWDHFRHEKIDASFYAPPWFITAFSSAFQYSPNSKLLEKIWDFFILDGVKTIFKVMLLILKEYQPEILTLKFDSSLNFITEIGKQELFTNIKYWEIKEGKIPIEEANKEYNFVENFERIMRNFHLPNTLMEAFDDDFEVFEKKLPELESSLNKDKFL